MKLDLGCGINKKEGFTGVDCLPFTGVDLVADLRSSWPWKEGSIEEIHTSHTIEHFTGQERVHFMNEAYRVLQDGGKITMIAPHWASCRAYGDPTHQWPPISEFWFFYLSKDWRAGNAPHTDSQHVPEGGYYCDFDVTWGYSLHEQVTVRNQEFQQFAVSFYKEAAQDIVATMVKKAT